MQNNLLVGEKKELQKELNKASTQIMISKLAAVSPNREDSPEALAELERISA